MNRALHDYVRPDAGLTIRASSPTRSQKSVRRLSDSSGISFDLTPSRSERGAKVSERGRWGGIALRTDTDLQGGLFRTALTLMNRQKPYRIRESCRKALAVGGD